MRIVTKSDAFRFVELPISTNEFPGLKIEMSKVPGRIHIEKYDSPNSACTMGFWRFQGLVIVGCPRAVPGHSKSLKNLQFLSFFKKMVLALEF